MQRAKAEAQGRRQGSGIFRSDVKETENRSDAHLPLKREHWTVQKDVLLRANLCQGLV